MKQNCWEAKACGREPGGMRSVELGVCPAATNQGANGLNDGQNGGRICWALTGTLCGGKVQGAFAQKLSDCMQCDFYMRVRTEEGPGTKSVAALTGKR